MDFTLEDLFSLVGRKEAENFVLRRRVAELEAALASASQSHEHPTPQARNEDLT